MMPLPADYAWPLGLRLYSMARGLPPSPERAELQAFALRCLRAADEDEPRRRVIDEQKVYRHDAERAL